MHQSWVQRLDLVVRSTHFDSSSYAGSGARLPSKILLVCPRELNCFSFFKVAVTLVRRRTLYVEEFGWKHYLWDILSPEEKLRHITGWHSTRMYMRIPRKEVLRGKEFHWDERIFLFQLCRLP